MRLRVAASTGFGSGLASSLVPLAAWVAVARNPHGYDWLFAAEAPRTLILRELAIVVGFQAILGIALGVATWWTLDRRPTMRRFLVGLCGAWGCCFLGALLVSPASFAVLPVVRAVPLGILVCVAAPASFALLGWRHVTRAALVAGVLLAAALAPRGPRSLPAAPTSGAPLLVFGIDAGGRSVLDTALGIVEREAPSAVAGGRVYERVVSQTPLTRVAWLGMLTGSDPTVRGVTQWISTRSRAETEAVLPAGWIQAQRAAGGRTEFLTDNAGSFFPSSRLFTRARAEGSGWQLLIGGMIRQRFPLEHVYLGRRLGVGVAAYPASASPWPLWRAAARDAGEAGTTFVASHAVALNQPANPTFLELTAHEWWTLSPWALIAGASPEVLLAGQAEGALSTRTLFLRRRAAMARDVAALLRALEAAGWRSRATIVVLADHGERFEALSRDRGGASAGLHGMTLHPDVIGTSVLVLPPRSADAPSLVHDTTGLHSLFALQALVTDASRGGSPADSVLPLRGTVRSIRTWDPVAGTMRRVQPLERLFEVATLRDDGDLTVPPAVHDALDAASDVGCATREEITALSPLDDGRILRRIMRWDGRVTLERIEAGPLPSLAMACRPAAP